MFMSLKKALSVGKDLRMIYKTSTVRSTGDLIPSLLETEQYISQSLRLQMSRGSLMEKQR